VDRILLVALLLTFIIAVTRPPSSDARFETRTAANQPLLDALARMEPQYLDSLGIATACLVIEVDTCRFRLYDARRQLLRQGPCATGMDSTLQAPDGRTWMFATPRGVRRVHHKSHDPVWQRPDWYYIEADLPLPAPEHPDRLAVGMLGDYALDVGQGYLVHGSPYQRGIGERITHGCVRLADDDLRAVYTTLNVGDRVVLR
jgi:L,D-transpeptidase YbiS